MAKTFLDLQNLRASKINETVAAKILDVDLARFYNEVTSDMSQFGQILKKVTTSIVANQADYDKTVLPGLIATATVKIGDVAAPFIGIEDYVFETDRNTIRHTIVNNSLHILPTPTVAVTNGLTVWYWGKLAEIVDAAVAGTSLAGLDDQDWNVVVSGVTLKMYEKLLAVSSISQETIPDASISAITKVVEYFSKKYNEALDNYGNSTRFFHSPATTKGPAARENEQPIGIGRQSGGF